MVAKLVSQEVEGPIGIVIYEETEPKHIHIYSVEIREDFRYKGDGRKMINYFREKNDYVELSSLPESKVFYEKC
jgi:ribosomal protein S18 acetylase RimI-like enzyme